MNDTQYKPKPRIVEAYQFTKENQLRFFDKWPEWLKEAYRRPPESDNSIYDLVWCWELSNENCNTSIIFNDAWIVNSDGNLSLYSPEEFERNFEKVE